ncbi:nucleoside-diphosphate kinase [Candidatus Falkowbacteria bacterium]|nr:nucleoside-diphosphate kinase [Candidatus Falkowbacteria bacterium]
MMQKTLILLKPDCVQRSLVGEIMNRFERKGLKIVAMKMIHLDDEVLKDHYAHLADKPFFPGLANFMKASPVIALALEGHSAVEVVRTLVGATSGRKADVGSIRGDYSISVSANLIHASDTPENAEIELKRFFKEGEIFNYQRVDVDFIYADDEK